MVTLRRLDETHRRGQKKVRRKSYVNDKTILQNRGMHKTRKKTNKKMLTKLGTFRPLAPSHKSSFK